MKNRILAQIALTTILYLVASFIRWDILWVLDVYKYSQLDRFAMVLAYAMFMIIYHGIFHEDIFKK